jgi:hypothetical protein
MTETANVVMCMITYLMTLFLDLLEQLGIFPDVVAYHEERGLDMMFA